MRLAEIMFKNVKMASGSISEDVTPVVAMQPVHESVPLEQPDVLIPKLRKLAVQMGVLGGSRVVSMAVLVENVESPHRQPQHQSLPP